MNLFSRNKNQPQTPAGTSPDLSAVITPEMRARVAALQTRNSTLQTAEDAVGAAQEAGGIISDLFKSIEAASKKAPASIASVSAPAVPSDDYDPDNEGFDPEGVDDGGDEPQGHEPEPAAPVSGGKWKGKFAKSLAVLAQGDETTAMALQPVFTAIETNEQSSAITNDYLEQVGGLLTKALEGIQVIGNNQHALAERFDAMETSQTATGLESLEQERAVLGDLKKSIEPLLEFVQNVRQTPQGTPRGRAQVSDAAINAPALGDAVPVVQRGEESYKGFSRGELKKSVEGAVRSGRYLSQGLSVSHFNMVAGDTPLNELPQVVFDVASAELKRPIPVASPAGTDE